MIVLFLIEEMIGRKTNIRIRDSNLNAAKQQSIKFHRQSNFPIIFFKFPH